MTIPYLSLPQLRALRQAAVRPIWPVPPLMRQTVRSLVQHGYLTWDGRLADRGHAFLQRLGFACFNPRPRRADHEENPHPGGGGGSGVDPSKDQDREEEPRR